MNGTPERVSAAEAAIMDTTSGSFSMSCDSTVTMICVSFLKPLGEQRPDRAVDQAGNQGLLFARAAFALEVAAGDFAGRVGLFPGS